MSSLAGAADDSALGSSRSRGGRRTPEQIERAYRDAFMILDRRISLLLCLPLASLDKLAIQKEVDRDRPPMRSNLGARIAAEFLGTAFLVAAVVGSGIMAERLAGGNVALALLANTIATGAVLVALLLAFGPISGAHLNPVVSLAEAVEGGISWRDAIFYILIQILGGIAGTIAAHAMFGLPLISLSHRVRGGPPLFLSEFIATFGLLSVIWGCSRSRPAAVPFAVGGYITAAYWFTASTSFANPAVTIARALSDTFAGIRPADVPSFIAAQVAGGIAATFLFRWLLPTVPARSQAADRDKKINLPQGAEI